MLMFSAVYAYIRQDPVLTAILAGVTVVALGYLAKRALTLLTRRRLQFDITRNRDLLPWRFRHAPVTIHLGDREARSMSEGSVEFRNTGNTDLKPADFSGSIVVDLGDTSEVTAWQLEDAEGRTIPATVTVESGTALHITPFPLKRNESFRIHYLTPRSDPFVQVTARLLDGKVAKKSPKEPWWKRKYCLGQYAFWFLVAVIGNAIITTIWPPA